MPKRPPKIYKAVSLRDLYRFYLKHFFGEKITDPRGVNIKFHRNNFPYLIQLENAGKPVKAAEVSQGLRQVKLTSEISIRTTKIVHKDFIGSKT